MGPNDGGAWALRYGPRNVGEPFFDPGDGAARSRSARNGRTESRPTRQ